MNIALFHGYELTGSGSNEYNRYLARALIALGHTVQLICREKSPESFDFINQAWRWDNSGTYTIFYGKENSAPDCIFHQIPSGDIYPVYLTDKQRPGNVKSFVTMTDQELESFKKLNESILYDIFNSVDIDILFANHLVMQPSIAINPCKANNIPFVIFAHGSAIEYTVRKDNRYLFEARAAIVACNALITGNREVCDRITKLYPDLKSSILEKTRIVGIGVDTSLFSPVAKSDRSKQIQSFLDSPLITSNNGKTQTLVTSLYESLQKDDYQPITRHFDLYNENSLDTNIVNKLNSIDTSKAIILFVGALTAGKGLQSLITAFPLLTKHIDNAQLLIIGSGAYREVLEALVFAIQSKNIKLLRWLTAKGFDLDRSNENGPWQDIQSFISHKENLDKIFDNSNTLIEQILFLGRMNHKQLSYLFPCADIAVFPSVVPEAYGLVLMEALANGVLPLVSYFSGFKDGIDELDQFLEPELVNAFKIDMNPKSRIDSIANNLIRLLEFTKQEKLAEKLANIARLHYDWRHRAESLSRILQAIISSRGP